MQNYMKRGKYKEENKKRKTARKTLELTGVGKLQKRKSGTKNNKEKNSGNIESRENTDRKIRKKRKQPGKNTGINKENTDGNQERKGN